MPSKNMFLVLLTIIIVLSAPMSAFATVPFSKGYKGPAQTVFIAMHYEDVSRVGHIQAELEQDLIALEYAFIKLQNEGILDTEFPRLIILASKHFTVDYRFDIAPTILSFTNSAFLVSNNPDIRQFAPENLGPAYVITTSIGLLSYNDLAAMLIHLGKLNEMTPIITIENEEKLLAAREHPVFDEIMNLNIRRDEQDIVSGNIKVSTYWDAGDVQYSLIDEAGSVIKELKPVDVYMGRPSWPPAERSDMQGRLIAYASKEQVIIYDIVKGKYYELSLDFEYKDPDAKRDAAYMEYQRVDFAMLASDNKVYVLPFGWRSMILVVYSLDLDTGKWLREAEGRAASELAWGNWFNGAWLDFVSAVSIKRVLNMDILTSEAKMALWTEYFGMDLVYNDEDKAINDEPTMNDEPTIKDVPVKDGKNDLRDEIPAEEALPVDEDFSGQKYFNWVWWVLLLSISAAAILFFLLRYRKKA